MAPFFDGRSHNEEAAALIPCTLGGNGCSTTLSNCSWD